MAYGTWFTGFGCVTLIAILLFISLYSRSFLFVVDYRCAVIVE